MFNKLYNSSEKLLNFKIKNFSCYYIFLFILRKNKNSLLLNSKNFVKIKTPNLKIWKNKLNKSTNSFSLIGNKNLISNINFFLDTTSFIFFLKRDKKNILLVLKNIRNNIFYIKIKNFYSIYFDRFYFKEKNLFNITNLSFKSFLYLNKFFKHDLLILIKKIIFFTTGF